MALSKTVRKNVKKVFDQLMEEMDDTRAMGLMAFLNAWTSDSAEIQSEDDESEGDDDDEEESEEDDDEGDEDSEEDDDDEGDEEESEEDDDEGDEEESDDDDDDSEDDEESEEDDDDDDSEDDEEESDDDDDDDDDNSDLDPDEEEESPRISKNKKVTAKVKPVVKPGKAVKPVAKVTAAPVEKSYTKMTPDELVAAATKIHLDYKPSKKSQVLKENITAAMQAVDRLAKKHSGKSYEQLVNMASAKGIEINLGRGRKDDNTKRRIALAAIVNASN